MCVSVCACMCVCMCVIVCMLELNVGRLVLGQTVHALLFKEYTLMGNRLKAVTKYLITDN